MMALVSVGACGSSGTTQAANTSDAGHEEAGGIGNGDAGGLANVDTTPIDISKTAMMWSWVSMDGAVCRDGSPTGIGINVNPASKELMIYLEGGGACYNSITCGMNPSCFGPPGHPCGGSFNYDTRLGTSASGQDGLFNRTDPGNPVKDWNFVYVPYCTGDVHAGAKPDGTISGVTGKQQFVGYSNMTRYLARLVPTFKGLDKVLLTGISAGGFGAAANYVQAAKAFAPVKVFELDDSGPPMEDPYLPKCLQQQWVQVWGFDKTVLADCGSDCPDPTNYSVDATIHVAKAYPNIPFGLIDSVDDGVITLFYGFGANNCMSALPVQVSAPQYEAGLLDARSKLMAAGITNVGGFIFPGNAHTSLGQTSTYESRVAGAGDAGTGDGGSGTKLSDWVTALVNQGTVSNVGP
jgi:hypothetical protein